MSDFSWIDKLPELDHYFYFGIYKKHKKLKTFITIPSRPFPDDDFVVDAVVQKTTPSNIKKIAKSFFAKHNIKEDKPKPKSFKSKKTKDKRQFVLYVVVKNGIYKLVQMEGSVSPPGVVVKSESFYIASSELDAVSKKFFEYYKENVYHDTHNDYGTFSVGDIVHHCDGGRTHSGVIIGIRYTAAMLVVCTTNPIWGRRAATKDELAFFAFKSRAQQKTLLSPAVRPYNELHKTDATFPIHRCEKLYKEMYGIKGDDK
ncbi:MAG TPA: hypothetical protein VMX17_04715 [Candidatus Glassbacteria bacterium]|nr:hypothetical protein [Candidatus Glassbacteria bacterium]